MRKIIEDIGFEVDEKSRAAHCFKILSKSMRKCSRTRDFGPEDWCSMTCRISTEKQNLEFFESRGWVPECLKDVGTVGEDLDCLGSLWYCLQKPRSMRSGHETLCFDMMGRFVIGLSQCDVIVMCWPAKSVFELGVHSWEATTFLDTIADEEWTGWTEVNLQHCRLSPGAVAWIPYGWSCCILGLVPNVANNTKAKAVTELGTVQSDQHWSNFVTMSLVSRKMFDKLDVDTRVMIQRHSPTQHLLDDSDDHVVSFFT